MEVQEISQFLQITINKILLLRQLSHQSLILLPRSPQKPLQFHPPLLRKPSQIPQHPNLPLQSANKLSKPVHAFPAVAFIVLELLGHLLAVLACQLDLLVEGFVLEFQLFELRLEFEGLGLEEGQLAWGCFVHFWGWGQGYILDCIVLYWIVEVCEGYSEKYHHWLIRFLPCIRSYSSSNSLSQKLTISRLNPTPSVSPCPSPFPSPTNHPSQHRKTALTTPPIKISKCYLTCAPFTVPRAPSRKFRYRSFVLMKRLPAIQMLDQSDIWVRVDWGRDGQWLGGSGFGGFQGSSQVKDWPASFDSSSLIFVLSLYARYFCQPSKTTTIISSKISSQNIPTSPQTNTLKFLDKPSPAISLLLSFSPSTPFFPIISQISPSPFLPSLNSIADSNRAASLKPFPSSNFQLTVFVKQTSEAFQMAALCQSPRLDQKLVSISYYSFFRKDGKGDWDGKGLFVVIAGLASLGSVGSKDGYQWDSNCIGNLIIISQKYIGGKFIFFSSFLFPYNQFPHPLCSQSQINPPILPHPIQKQNTNNYKPKTSQNNNLQINLQMKIQDALDREQSTYNLSGQYQNTNSKQAMQNLYKQQLDSLLEEKNKQRSMERSRELAQKREFNQRAINNKESEKIKEQAYKNYYNMLLTNQEQMQAHYISPFSGRDALKDQHIQHSVQQGEMRTRQWQIEQRKRQADRKNMYRSQLMHQIQERKRQEHYNREDEQRKKQEYRKYNKLPEQITKYERQRHMEEMQKYKEDLDKFKYNKDEMTRSRVKSEQNNIKVVADTHHNAIINPMPYNIQNPYILREMSRQNYLGQRANQNILT